MQQAVVAIVTCLLQTEMFALPVVFAVHWTVHAGVSNYLPQPELVLDASDVILAMFLLEMSE